LPPVHYIELSDLLANNHVKENMCSLQSPKPEVYSVPAESANVFQNGILQNPLIAKTLPPEFAECSQTVHFEGSDQPSIPINWRFAESISSLKAFEAAFVNLLLKRRFGLEPQEIVINT
jgi:hypothetical protein